MKVIADDKIPFLRGVLEPFGITVVYRPGGAINADDLKDADALITRTRTRCDATLLESNRSLKFIATATIGFDHLDRDFLARRNIVWTNAPGCNANSVAQYLAAALTQLAHKHHFALPGRTLGIVGVGNVGTRVAQVAQALGMRILQCDPPRARMEKSSDFVALETVLKNADLVTCHVPLTREGADATFHLLDRNTLTQMRPDQILINTSRGEVVDGAALKTMLRTGRLGGAVLDVWESEPGIDRELQTLLDFGTPHIAGYSTDGKANGTAMSVRALAKFFALPEPLQHFYPANLPEPEFAEIELSTAATEPEAVCRAIAASYAIAQDDGNLRRTPEQFEALRGNYGMRREFGAFRIQGGTEPTRKICHALGFQTANADEAHKS